MSKTKEPSRPTQERKYKDNLTFDHDLYRLETTEMVRNMSWNKKPMWENFDHKHFFHTFDSEGRKQTKSTAALGHFHPMILEQSAEGVPVVKCGPAMKEVLMRDEDTGEYKKTAIELKGREAHVHPVNYLHSERLKTRKVNDQAAVAISNVLAHQTPNLTPEERKAIKETGREKVE